MIEELRYKTQAVLPTVYDDSLSYYELLNKVVQKLNEVIEQINVLTEQINNQYPNDRTNEM